LELADTTIDFLRGRGVRSPELDSLVISLQWEKGDRQGAISALRERPSTASSELTLGDWLWQLDSVEEAREHLHTASQLCQSVRVWQLWSLASLKLFEQTEKSNDRLLVDALEGSLSGLALSSHDSLSFCVRILSILFRRPSVKAAFERFRARLHDVPVHVWIGVMPQIIARANSEDADLRELIQALILAVGREHPHVVLYSLMVPLKGEANERQRVAGRIFEALQIAYPTITSEMLSFSNELIRSAVTWWEVWHSTLDEASRVYITRHAMDEMSGLLIEAHLQTNRSPETLYESMFLRQFGSQIATAQEFINRWNSSNRSCEEFLHAAWNIYVGVFRQIGPLISSIGRIALADAAPNLGAMRDLKIIVPGTYVFGEEPIIIRAVDPTMSVMASKQRPRRMGVTGSDGVHYTFLLKAHEDTRLDERVMQFFELINSLLLQATFPLRDRMSITTYRVIPLTGSVGLIGWVPECNTLYDVIVKNRSKDVKVPVEIESATLQKLAPKYETLELQEKLTIFKRAIASSPANDLKQIILSRAIDSNHWIERRTSYSASLSATSIAGYILGLGDRHLSNIMMKQWTAKLVHIDFGDCFEVAINRDKFPEKVPFRLTRMLRNGLEVSGIEGTFRNCCENLMQLIHDNREQIKGLLEVFVDDPLLQWITQGDQGDEGQSKKIIVRIESKLNGMDFEPSKIYTVPEQVRRLIDQATRLENLCVMFRGWLPWW
jgi:FKBP12-rapamycin complex-associated protein